MHRVICFGEVLWDLLPRGRFLGGAPLNVAYHLAQLGCPAALASAVGSDTLGNEALAAVAAAGVDARGVSRHPTLPTGTATVRLDAAGQPSFHLPEPVAWDEIAVDPLVHEPAPTALVFGTLALRRPANRSALERLFHAFPHAWIVCDLNLRPPHDDVAPLAALIEHADLLKLNADEARRLSGRPASASDWAAMAADLSRRHHGAIVCITLGADGAGLWDGSAWHQAAAPAVAVRDTVGAGDAFAAALVAGHLRGPAAPDWPRLLNTACAVGSFVAGEDGAQPSYGDFRPVW